MVRLQGSLALRQDYAIKFFLTDGECEICVEKKIKVFNQGGVLYEPKNLNG